MKLKKQYAECFSVPGVMAGVGDTVAPVPVITSVASATVYAAFDITVTFSEDVTGFEVGDIDVTNGGAGSFSAVSGSVYTATITPTTSGTVTVAIAAGVCQDAAGNDNASAVDLTREYASYDDIVQTVIGTDLIQHLPLSEASGTTATDLSTEANNGTISGAGVTYGVPGIGDNRTGITLSNTAGFVNLYSAGLAADFNGAEGTLLFWWEPYSAVLWRDATIRILVGLDTVGDRVLIFRTTSNNFITFEHKSGGVGKQIEVQTMADDRRAVYALTWSASAAAGAGEIKAYIFDRAHTGQVGTTQAFGGTFSGSLSSTRTVLGAQTTTPGGVVGGTFAHWILAKRALTPAEVAQLATAPAVYNSGSLYVQLDEPRPYQVFQRSGATGSIYVNGIAYRSGTLEYQWGGDWTTLGAVTPGAFSFTLTGLGQGQNTFAVRYVGETIETQAIQVGIGDVYVVAGQSNASGRGTNNQTYSHASLKAGLFDNAYVHRELTDPFDRGAGQIDTVSYDIGALGSVWPLVATSVMADQGVPVSFIPCPLGGTRIATDWAIPADRQNRATLYGSMVYRTLQAHGAKAVLWWQGENDADAGVLRAAYNASLDALAAAIDTDLGIPIMPCKLQNSTAIPDAAELEINNAIGDAWADNPLVLTGPDLTGLTSDDGYHLTTDVNLAAAATLWWAALQTAFYT